MDNIFMYDKELSYDQNFTEWRTMNAEERRNWGDEQLTQTEAQQMFDKLFGQYKLQGTK